MKLNEQDLKTIEKKGLTLEKVKKQIETFKMGLPYTYLLEAATIENGIIALDDNSMAEAISFFNAHRSENKILKFVPASGAASRMFKFLFEFLKAYDPEKESVNSYINKHQLRIFHFFWWVLISFRFTIRFWKK